MEIRKLRSQLPIVLERVSVHLQGAWSALARLGRGAAEKLQVSFHDAVIVTNGKIEKFRSQLPIVLEGMSVHLQGAWGTLARLGRGAAEKLQVSFHDDGIGANGKIEKFRSQLPIVLEGMSVPLQGAWGTLARLGRGAAEKLQVSFHDAVIVTNGKIEKFRSQLPIVLEGMSV